MDNEQEVRGSLEEYFGRHGQELKLNLKVWTFFSGSQFLAERMPFDLVCLDIEMPEMNGLELAAKIRFLRRNPCRLRLFNGCYLGKFRSGSGGGAFCKMQGTALPSSAARTFGATPPAAEDDSFLQTAACPASYDSPPALSRAITTPERAVRARCRATP